MSEEAKPDDGKREEVGSDFIEVTWDGPDDPENPKNWSKRRKYTAVLTVSMYTLMTQASSSVVAPAEHQIGKDLNIHSTFLLNLVFSIFLLGFVAGPLVMAPLSELYGRTMILRLANLFFIAWTIGCSFSQNVGELLAFRLLAGMGACAPQTVGGGVLSDCFVSEERGRAVVIYSLAPVLGPSLAPLVGGFIVEYISWRWCFWILAMIGAVVQVALWVGLPETFAPRILTLKAQRLRKESNDPRYRSPLEMQDLTSKHRTAHIIEHAIGRPMKLIATQPIVQFLALYLGLVFGIIFIILSIFPSVWTKIYGESISIGGLNYLSLAIGMIIGAQSGGFLMDPIYRRLKENSPTKTGSPEFRIPLLFPACTLLGLGLLLFGWTAQYHVQWVVPNVGTAMFGAGTMLSRLANLELRRRSSDSDIAAVIQTYTIDAYPSYAASAISVTAVARSLTGFGFPLFADAMFDSLGYGWGCTVLGLGSLGIGLGGALVLWFYGGKLRARSQYASG